MWHINCLFSQKHKIIHAGLTLYVGTLAKCELRMEFDKINLGILSLTAKENHDVVLIKQGIFLNCRINLDIKCNFKLVNQCNSCISFYCYSFITFQRFHWSGSNYSSPVIQWTCGGVDCDGPTVYQLTFLG